MVFSLKRRPGVAVVEIYGVIGTTVKDSAYSRLFESIARNKRFGALLLDIDQVEAAEDRLPDPEVGVVGRRLGEVEERVVAQPACQHQCPAVGDAGGPFGRRRPVAR